MLTYVLKRLGYAVLVVWAAYTVTFLLLFRLPSDPITLMLAGGTTDGGNWDESQRVALEQKYGFDRSPLAQYFLLLGRAATGDFGTSMNYDEPVLTVLARSLTSTLELAGLGLLFALVLGFGIGIAAVWTRWVPLQRLLRSLPPIMASLPAFWVGLLLLQIFSFKLGWFPAVGGTGLQALVLPALALAVPTAAAYAQVLYGSLEQTLKQPFIAVVELKGASRLRVFASHALKNAVIPVLTLIALSIGAIFAGVVVTETVFARNGIGRLLELSVGTQDIPVVQALVLLTAVAYALVNLIMDLSYPLIDPRVK